MSWNKMSINGIDYYLVPVTEIDGDKQSTALDEYSTTKEEPVISVGNKPVQKISNNIKVVQIGGVTQKPSLSPKRPTNGYSDPFDNEMSRLSKAVGEDLTINEGVTLDRALTNEELEWMVPAEEK